MSVRISRVILLAGPSGSGKSYHARRTGLPVLCLDDFYKDGTDPTLPQAHGRIDWESPLSWDARSAVDAIATAARTGRVTVPRYDFGRNRRVTEHTFVVGDEPLFIAEGIFAAEIVDACRTEDVLAEAFALTRQRTVTFARRLARDLSERRKPPMLLARRGIELWRAEPRVLARQRSLGCTPANASKLARRVDALRAAHTADRTGTAGRTIHRPSTLS